MAFTIVRTNSVFGNMRSILLEVTADAAESNIDTGLKKIVAFSYGPKSMNSSNIHLAANSNSTGLAAMGILGVSGCTSGDNFFVVVHGQ